MELYEGHCIVCAAPPIEWESVICLACHAVVDYCLVFKEHLAFIVEVVLDQDTAHMCSSCFQNLATAANQFDSLQALHQLPELLTLIIMRVSH